VQCSGVTLCDPVKTKQLFPIAFFFFKFKPMCRKTKFLLHLGEVRVRLELDCTVILMFSAVPHVADSKHTRGTTCVSAV
jgi:hypothetical protein